MNRIIYILSDNRSGSTLLDQLLGSHDRIISVGEVHHLAAYARQDRSLYNPVHPLRCSCGLEIDRCPFWAKIQKRLDRPFASLRLKLRYFNGSRESTRAKGQQVTRILRRFLTRNPRIFLNPIVSAAFNARRVGADSFCLFDAIHRETAVDYLVDSSKEPFRFRALYDAHPERVVAIMLARDYRGAVHSKVKRGRDLRASAGSWAARLKQMKQLTVGIPQDRLIRVKYEDLCTNTAAELERICNFIGLKFSNVMLTRPAADVHHLGGSPSKFDPARRTIKLDLSYMHAFSDSELAAMREIVGDIAKEWGYS